MTTRAQRIAAKEGTIRDIRPAGLRRTCPRCGAIGDEPCVSAHGYVLFTPHSGRTGLRPIPVARDLLPAGSLHLYVSRIEGEPATQEQWAEAVRTQTAMVGMRTVRPWRWLIAPHLAHRRPVFGFAATQQVALEMGARLMRLMRPDRFVPADEPLDLDAYPTRKPYVRLTDEQKAELVGLYKEGESVEDLAYAFDIGPSTVRNHLNAAGVRLRGKVA